MMNGSSSFAARRGSLLAACGAALVMVVVLAGAATIVTPLSANIPAGTDVAASDTSGVNLLEPAVKASGSEPKEQLTGTETVERVVSEWTPTGGGGPGGGGSPKK